MSKQQEAKLKKQILDYLKLKGIFCWNNRNVGVYNPKTGCYIPSPIKGISDIIGILPNGKFLAIEVKTNKNKPTKNQLWFIEEIKRNNGVGIIAYNLDDVIDELEPILHKEVKIYGIYNSSEG